MDRLELAERIERYAPELSPDNRADELEMHQAVVLATGVGSMDPPFNETFLRSLDAAMSLVPEGCVWIAGDYKGMANAAFWQGKHQYAKGWASVSDTGEPPGDPAMPTYRSHAMTPALALTAAALRASHSQSN